MTQGALLLQVTGKAESAAKKTADKAESATKNTANKAESATKKTADNAESATKKSANGTSDSVVCTYCLFPCAHAQALCGDTQVASAFSGTATVGVYSCDACCGRPNCPAQKATQLCWERSLHRVRYGLALRTAPTAAMMPLQDSAAEEAQAMVHAI